MKTIVKRVSELRFSDYNPRTITDAAYEGLKRSIERFGLVEPLVWNEKTDTIVGGHMRLRVLQDLGIEEVPVTVVHLDLDEEKALNVTLNNQWISGQFDRDALGTVLSELEGLDYPLEELRLEKLMEVDLGLIEENDATGGGADGEDIPDADDDGPKVIQLVFSAEAYRALQSHIAELMELWHYDTASAVIEEAVARATHMPD